MKIFFIGTDEAGYGPNLGPLIVSASCWKYSTSAARSTDLALPDLNPLDSNSLDSNPLEPNSLDSNPLDSNPLEPNSLDSNPLESNPLTTRLPTSDFSPTPLANSECDSVWSLRKLTKTGKSAKTDKTTETTKISKTAQTKKTGRLPKIAKAVQRTFFDEPIGSQWNEAFDRPDDKNNNVKNDEDWDCSIRELTRFNAAFSEISGKKGPFPVADSKKLYHASGPLSILENTVLLSLALLSDISRDWPKNQTGIDDSTSDFLRLFGNNVPFRDSTELPRFEPRKTFDLTMPKTGESASKSEQNKPVAFSEKSNFEQAFSLRSLLSLFCVEETPAFWEETAALAIPLDPRTDTVEALQKRRDWLQTYFETRGIALANLKSRRVSPQTFNALLDSGLLKSDVLAQVTLDLVWQTLEEIFRSECCGAVEKTLENPLSIVVLCDKFGGRNSYGPLLRERFGDCDVQILAESRALSVYRIEGTGFCVFPLDEPSTQKSATFRPVFKSDAENRAVDRPPQTALIFQKMNKTPQKTNTSLKETASISQTTFASSVGQKNVRWKIEFRFQAKGESNIPTALASMVSKYLREGSMLMWNRYWQNLDSALKPTAGYPVDARRFFAEISEWRKKMAFPDDWLWRKK